LATNLTEKKVGKVIEVELNVNGAGNFVRAQVKLDVRNPLAGLFPCFVVAKENCTKLSINLY
jgi:hypothetical protein